MRIGIVLLLSLLTSGCQLQQQVKEIFAEPKPEPELDCFIGRERLSGLLIQEGSYLEATAQTRKTMLTQAMSADDFAQSALLLSQPASIAADLEKSLQQFRKQALRPSLECPGDRYVMLRYAQAKLLLKEKQQSVHLQRENNALRKQIEALTQIEQEISRDREISQ